MIRPFEEFLEGQETEVEFTLNVKCTEGRSLDVTDLDLVPVGTHHSVTPVTQALMKQQGGSVKPGGRRCMHHSRRCSAACVAAAM
jgi:hypothetical protein